MPAEFFTEAMERVRTNYLDVPIDAVLHPTSASARQVTENQQVAANAAPKVEEKELTAQEWFEQGFKSTDIEKQIRAYTEGLRLDPTSAFAYNNRGNARQNKDDLDGALQDYTEALRLDPTSAFASTNRELLKKKRRALSCP